MEKVFIHETAIVDDGAVIGDGCKIWHWSHICGSAIINEDVTLGQNTFVGPHVKIGKGSKIQNNVSLFEGVVLQDFVFVGPSVVFTNVKNPRAAIARKTEFKSTVIGKGTTIGANATIVCGVTIGDYSFVGAGAVLTKDTQPFSLMVGTPAKQVGWVSAFGERIDLPLNGFGEYICRATGHKYVLRGALLSRSET